MAEDYVRLAVFDNRGTAFEVLRMLHANDLVEATAWPVAPRAVWRAPDGPYMVTVAKSRIREAQTLMNRSGLWNRVSSDL